MPSIPPAAQLVHLLLLSLTLLPVSLRGNGESSTALENEFAQWDAFLKETDLFLEETGNPFAEFESNPIKQVVWSSSLRAGAGHSSNFLKREQAVSSPYVKVEGELVLNTRFSNSNFTSLVYFEGTRYDRDAQVDEEAIVFLHANWTEIRPAYSYGLETNVFYGDQIYDSSLSVVSTPMGASLRQFRPEISIFSDWDIGPFDSLKAALSLRRTLIDDEDEDYWRPQVSLEWNRVWSGSIGSRTVVALYQESYDDEPARTATGMTILPEKNLRITGLEIETVLTWKPVRWEAISSTVRIGAARERDLNDAYDNLTRLQVSVNSSLDLEYARIGISGSWQNTRYKDRQVSSVDARPVRQIYRSLEMELEKALGWNISLRASVQWNTFDSRVSGDSFSERRVHALLDWTY